MALASGPEREDPVATVASDNLDVPSTYQLHQAHAQRRRRGEPAAEILSQRRALLLQVEQQLVVS
jgi:hypothetical protein